MKKREIMGIMQIALLIASVFAFAYIIREIFYYGDFEKNRKDFKRFGFLRALIGIVLNEKNLVSAQQNNVVETCLISKEGGICEEFLRGKCDEKCEKSCFPGKKEDYNECEPGTCYDPVRGTCNEGSIKKICEDSGGEWFNNVNGNVPQCRKACCIVGEEVFPLRTERECRFIGERKGIEAEYRNDIVNELECLYLQKQEIEGACVFEQPGKNDCSFTTFSDCSQREGVFYEGYLCSNPALNTSSEKQKTARCVEGKDEIYWFDSQGNRENIYDINKEKSWNNGFVLSKNESCSLGNNLQNQDKCGNCNRFKGSVCGEKLGNEKLADNTIDFVCRDLRCKDSNGKIRKNGESWCVYRSDIGIDESVKLKRSVDTPGSEHFIRKCIDGEIQTELCGNARNKICVEDKFERDSKEISQASCITNPWQLCIQYNVEMNDKIARSKKKERKNIIKERDEKCQENPLCMLKRVNLENKEGGFKFDTCIPKFPSGTYFRRDILNNDVQKGQDVCALGTKTCTAIFIRGITGWDCKFNCDCLKDEFTKQMNDLCMSLGDCGASANYIGDFSDEGYHVNKKAKKLKSEYINKIKEYSEPIKGKYAKLDNVTKYMDLFGGLNALGLKAGLDMSDIEETQKILQIGGLISGALGSLLTIEPIYTGLMITELFIANIFTDFTIMGGLVLIRFLEAFNAGLIAAAIAFAITTMLIQMTGISAGMDPAITWTIVGIATVGAGVSIGAATAAGFAAGAGGFWAGFGGAFMGTAGGLSAFAIIGIILFISAITTIIVFKIMGVGEIREIKTVFNCMQWQPRDGGMKCGECGKDGLPCTAYSCQSLGKNCMLLNEGSDSEECTDINPNDIISPQIISPWKESLTKGLKYEDVSERGFKIKKNSEDGCIEANSMISFGFKTDEYSKCMYSSEHTNNFDEMDEFFGNTNLFLKNHSHMMIVPSLERYGIGGYDPNRRVDFNMYIRCIDSNGNGKDSAEYIINICLKPGIDKTNPVIISRDPAIEETAFNATILRGGVILNEPSTCKWDIEDKDYEQMENEMDCNTDFIDPYSRRYECYSDFPINNSEERYYIQCKDQPWLVGENETRRNSLTNTYEFNITRTQYPLKIISASPDNETLVFGGVNAGTITIRVETDGGYNKKAICKIRVSGENQYHIMENTFERVHTQNLNAYFEEENKYDIKCEDMAGNIAYENISFNVKLDKNPPKITRAYILSGKLNIITNEDSECRFVKSKKVGCGFEFKDGTAMEGEGKEHYIDIDDMTYYIKCKDNFNNINGGCDIIIRKYRIESEEL